MKTHGMMLVRNEASKDRWLHECLINLYEICDEITILDDNSDDDTIKLINQIFKHVNFNKYYIFKNDECLWETNEVEARKKLFSKTIEKCEHGDWIICLDADELFCDYHIDYIRYNLKHLYKTYPIESIDSLGFKLFDMWSNTHYRFDKWWTGHLRYWPMAIRYNKNIEYKWSDKKLHCGRFPLNSASHMNPSNIPIMHMGWSNEKLRKQKYNRYMKLDGERQDGLIEQYKSILDENPNLIEF